MRHNDIPSDRRRALLMTGTAGLTAVSSGCLGLVGLLSDDSSPPGMIYALDLDDGSPRWTRTVDNAIQSAVAVGDDTIYVGADDGRLRALSASDGSINWTTDTADQAFEDDPDSFGGAFITTDVALGAGGVYVGTDQAGFVGVDAETGEKRWRIRLESPYAEQKVTVMRSTPAVADGTVAFGTNDDQVSSDGDTIWEQEITGLTGGSPAVGDGMVFVGSDEGVSALDAETGAELWVTPAMGHWVDSQPTVGNGSVFAVARSGTVVAFARDDGTERWTADVGAHASTSPAVADGLIVAGDRNGRIIALDAADGSEAWGIETEDPVTATPVVADGTVYVGTK